MLHLLQNNTVPVANVDICSGCVWGVANCKVMVDGCWPTRTYIVVKICIAV